MAARKRPPSGGDRLTKLLGLCEALPEIDVSGDQHLAFRIRKKTFAYYLNDHHGDGIVSICCKSTTQRQQDLVSREPERYYVPRLSRTEGLGRPASRPPQD
jgi:hypothetical protein